MSEMKEAHHDAIVRAGGTVGVCVHEERQGECLRCAVDATCAALLENGPLRPRPRPWWPGFWVGVVIGLAIGALLVAASPF